MSAPVAAPGMADHRAQGAALALTLDDAAALAQTELDFARLQLGEQAAGELSRAVTEAQGASTDLSQTLATTRGAPTQGPASTAAAGHLGGALSRARAAGLALEDARTRVARATRELDPPSG